jgi:hypothetical protein
MHCRKTGGTSIKAALSRHLGPYDLNLGAWRARGMRFNRRFWMDLAAPDILASLAWGMIKSQRLPNTRTLSYLQKRAYTKRLGPTPEHTTAELASKYFAREWPQYFKFCFVRNPYEQVVSAWFYRQKWLKTQYSFSLYLELCAAGEPHRFIPERYSNWPIYTIEDKIAVDFVGRYERINEDMTVVFDLLRLPAEKLPKANSRPSSYNYRDYYTATDRKLAARLFEKELDMFGYTF